MNLKAKYAPWLAMLMSGGLLVGAWTFQYGFGYPPCTMCYWQRHAHKIVLFIAIMSLGYNIVGRGHTKVFNVFLMLAFLGSAYMAFWHMGVEYKWWEGPQTCAAGGSLDGFDPNDPLGGLDKKIKGPACSDALWHFLGLSMAAWNGIISLMGAGVMLMTLRKDKTHA